MAHQVQNEMLLCQTTACFTKTNWRGWICHDNRGVRDLVPTPVGFGGGCFCNNNTGFDIKHTTHAYKHTLIHTNTHSFSLCLWCAHKCFGGEATECGKDVIITLFRRPLQKGELIHCGDILASFFPPRAVHPLWVIGKIG